MNRQKKIAAINDISGYGRCALTVTIPVISARKVQCCPVLTSILSNHTGYPDFFFDDYTEKLPKYIEMWKKLDLEFDGILTGFLGSQAQFEIVSQFIDYFKKEKTKIIVDPIMGDHGKAYATYTEEMCAQMKHLVSHADVITPNLTEACILTGTSYQSEGWEMTAITRLAGLLHDLGPRQVIITGIRDGESLINAVSEQGTDLFLSESKRVGSERPGTGDIFASIVAADVINGVPLRQAVRTAESFISACILRSDELAIPVLDGVCFEEELGMLTGVL